MKRTGFARKIVTQVLQDPQMRADARHARLEATTHAGWLGGARGTYAGALFEPDPKPEEWRYPALLEMARDRQCLLRVPGVCRGRTDTVVACHGNGAEYGKANARKADDCFSVHGCALCHQWLDQGKAPGSVRNGAFVDALERQIVLWRHVAGNPNEPERFRRAARAALDELKRRGYVA